MEGSYEERESSSDRYVLGNGLDRSVSPISPSNPTRGDTGRRNSPPVNTGNPLNQNDSFGSIPTEHVTEEGISGKSYSDYIDTSCQRLSQVHHQLINISYRLQAEIGIQSHHRRVQAEGVDVSFSALTDQSRHLQSQHAELIARSNELQEQVTAQLSSIQNGGPGTVCQVHNQDDVQTRNLEVEENSMILGHNPIEEEQTTCNVEIGEVLQDHARRNVERNEADEYMIEAGSNAERDRPKEDINFNVDTINVESNEAGEDGLDNLDIEVAEEDLASHQPQIAYHFSHPIAHVEDEGDGNDTGGSGGEDSDLEEILVLHRQPYNLLHVVIEEHNQVDHGHNERQFYQAEFQSTDVQRPSAINICGVSEYLTSITDIATLLTESEIITQIGVANNCDGDLTSPVHIEIPEQPEEVDNNPSTYLSDTYIGGELDQMQDTGEVEFNNIPIMVIELPHVVDAGLNNMPLPENIPLTVNDPPLINENSNATESLSTDSNTEEDSIN